MASECGHSIAALLIERVSVAGHPVKSARLVSFVPGQCCLAVEMNHDALQRSISPAKSQ
jgi:hypothetical protein